MEFEEMIVGNEEVNPKKNVRLKTKKFTDEEVNYLLKLLKCEPLITSKQTDSDTQQWKQLAWERLTDKFNMADFTQYRSEENLKNKFEAMKKLLRAKLVSKDAAHEVLEAHEEALLDVLGIGSGKTIVVTDEKNVVLKTDSLSPPKRKLMKTTESDVKLKDSLKPFLDYGEIETLEEEHPEATETISLSGSKRERLILPRPSVCKISYVTSSVVPGKTRQLLAGKGSNSAQITPKKPSKRTPNFTSKETDRLLQLVQAEPAIMSKKQDNRSLMAKRLAWHRVANSLALEPGFTYRTPETLRCRYENVKKNWKMKQMRLEDSADSSVDASVQENESGLRQEHDYSVVQQDSEDETGNKSKLEYQVADLTTEEIGDCTFEANEEMNATEDADEQEESPEYEEEPDNIKVPIRKMSVKQKRNKAIEDISGFAIKKQILLSTQHEAAVLDKVNKELMHQALKIELEVKKKELELVNEKLRQQHEKHALEMDILKKNLENNA